jgi:hypothetical protein
MKRKLGITFMVLSTLFFLSCSAKYTKRYHSIIIEPVKDNCHLVKVSTFTMGVPSSARNITLLQLSPQGQAAFIKALENNVNNSETLLEVLGKNVGSSPKSRDIIDLTTFRKRVVFSVEKQTFTGPEITVGPADRLDQLLINLSQLKGAKFVSWDKFETKYETVDLGKISNTQGFELGIDIPIKSPEISTSTGISQSLSEEVLLRQRYVALSGRLYETEANLYQQGVSGIDLAGNFSVDFLIKAEVDESKPHTVISLKNLWKGSNPNENKAIGISFLKIKYPKSSQPVTCNLDFYYSLRHVKKYGDTISEADDIVTLIRCHDNGTQQVELIGKNELRVRVYYIVTHKDVKTGSPSPNGYRLYIKGPGQGTNEICFADYNSAASFLQWLRLSKSVTIGKYEIGLPTKPERLMVEEDIPFLYVYGENLN